MELDSEVRPGGDQDRLARSLIWFEEATTCAAGNLVSFATGTSTQHEALGRAPSGGWWLRSWTDGEPETEMWRTVSTQEARDWLLRNEQYEVIESHFPRPGGGGQG